MSDTEQYDKAHHIAKAIVFAIVVLLLVLARYFDLLVLDIAAVGVWFFMVNPIGYLVESVLHFNHKHNIF